MAQINFRIEDDIKTEADFIFGQLGLSMSSALTIFIRQVIDRRGIPFELKLSDSSLSSPDRILQAARDYADGKKNYHFHELPSMNFDEPEMRSNTCRRSARAKAMV